jgi:hypothetical protein
MKNLPSEQKIAAEKAKQKFKECGKLIISEPCDCGSHIRHNNGGNYHEIIHLAKDSGKFFRKDETTCELMEPAEWGEISEMEAFATIDVHADWL